MKKLAAVTIAAASLLAATAQAASPASQQFNVNVTLSSQCRVDPNTPANPALNFGTYTAFGSATTTAPTAVIQFECTRNFAPATVAFDTIATNSTNTGEGVVAGLRYSITTATATAAGTPATATNGGSGDIHTITLTGTMPSGQAGDCASNTCAGTDPRSLIISW